MLRLPPGPTLCVPVLPYPTLFRSLPARRCIERPVRTVDRLERTADRAATGGENRCVGRVEQVTAERGRIHVEAFGRRRIGRGRGIAITVGATPDYRQSVGEGQSVSVRVDLGVIHLLKKIKITKKK